MTGTVLITGASRGIGRAAALLFGKQGWNVAVGFHQNDTSAREVVDTINADWTHAQAFQADVSDNDAVRAMISAAEDRFGEIDVLVNNAGMAWYGLLQDMPPADMRRILDVNMLGTAYCTQAVLPGMLARGRGAVVYVSSMWGIHGGSCEVMYSASKAAVIGFTKAIAKEVGPAGIRVNCIAPGPIDTDMMRVLSEEDRDAVRSETALGMLGEPDDVAQAIWFLATDSARFITGTVLSVNGGMYT